MTYTIAIYDPMLETSMAEPNSQATVTTNNESNSKVKPLSYKFKMLMPYSVKAVIKNKK